MAATLADFTSNISESPGVDLCVQWPAIVRAVQSLTAYFRAKGSTGTEPTDILTSIVLGDATAAAGNAYRLREAASALFVDRTSAPSTFASLLRLDNSSCTIDVNADNSFSFQLESGSTATQAIAFVFRDGSLAAGAGEAVSSIRKSTTNQLLLQTQNVANSTSAIRIERNDGTSGQNDSIVINADGSMTVGDSAAISIAATGAVTINTTLLFPSGTVGAPGIAFSAEPSLGIYRAAAGQGGLVASGANALLWNVGANPQVQVPFGSGAALPGLAFLTDNDTGLRRTAANTLALVAGGADALTATAALTTIPTALTVTGAVAISSTGLAITPTGDNTTPAVRNATDTSTGVRWTTGSGGLIGFVSNAKQVCRANGTGSNQRLEFANGTTSLPSIVSAENALNGAGNNGTTTGLYWNTTTATEHYLGVTANTVDIAHFWSDSDTPTLGQIQAAQDGSNTRPSFSFVNFTGAGMHVSSTFLQLAHGGTTTARFTSTQAHMGAGASGAIGSQAAPALVFGANDVNTGFWKAADDDLRCGANNTEVWRVTSNAFRHVGTSLGFYNTAPATQQTPTGSRGGNAALASLLTALATIGLIVDGTSA